MATHLFRPADPTVEPEPPIGTWTRAQLARAAGYLVAQVAGLFNSPASRAALHICLLVLGIVGQVVLLLLAGYLVDLSISLMELWAELARKHLELTL